MNGFISHGRIRGITFIESNSNNFRASRILRNPTKILEDGGIVFSDVTRNNDFIRFNEIVIDFKPDVQGERHKDIDMQSGTLSNVIEDISFKFKSTSRRGRKLTVQFTDDETFPSTPWYESIGLGGAHMKETDVVLTERCEFFTYRLQMRIPFQIWITISRIPF